MNEQLRVLLKQLMSKTNYFQRVGHAYEGVFTVAIEEINNEKARAELVGGSYHQLTTDVQVFLNDVTSVENAIGYSLKTNSTKFHKTQNRNTLTTNVIDGNVSNLLTRFINLYDSDALKYYSLNVRALSLVAYNGSYSDYVEKHNNTYKLKKEPDGSLTKPQKLENFIDEFDKMLAQIFFIKAVVGSMADDSDQDRTKALENKALPVILSTPGQDY
jgi:hypothetical protein